MTIYTRTTRDTRETLTVATAVEFGADPDGGRWITFCEDHGTIVNNDTRQLALDTRGIDFCDDCQDRIRAEAARTARISETLDAMRAAAEPQESPYARSFPLAAPADAHWTDTVVTQGHVDYCAEHGHATFTNDGVISPRCPRCGELIAPDAADALDPHRVLPCGCYADAPMGHTCASGGDWDATRR